MASLHEILSRRFCEWEQRGRGWQVWPEAVELEPPFIPFEGHTSGPDPGADDGRRPNRITSALVKIGLLPGPEGPGPLPVPGPAPGPAVMERSGLIELRLSLPSRFSPKFQDLAPVFRHLGHCRGPLAFEMLGTGERTILQFAADEDDAPALRRQLTARFPEIAVSESRDTLAGIWEGTDDSERLVVEFGLAREFAFPLALPSTDPYVGLAAALNELARDEAGLFQVLFQPVENPWAAHLMQAVTGPEGKAFFQNAPELTKCAEEKIASPLFAVVVRMAVRAEDVDRILEIAKDMAGALRLFARLDGNELIPLHNEEYPYEAHLEDVVLRQSRRSGMLLNAEELTGFVHLPTAEVRASRLERGPFRSKAAPKANTGLHSGLLLGQNIHAGHASDVRLSPDERARHVHLTGASGTGKSTLLLNWVRQDIEAGQGIAVLDPHGDLIERAIDAVPEHRIADVIVFDPSDGDFPIGFNVLSAHSDLEKNLLASDLVSVFQRLSTSWGDQMGSVLQNAILAFLESSRGGTLADLRRFLLEAAYRNEFLDSVNDPEMVYYWRKAFPQLSGNRSLGPVLTRLESFLAPKPVRYMVSQRVNKLDFREIMDTGRIFLAKLSQGQIGRENAFLLGSLLMAKFQQTAMGRQGQDAAARRPFWLYLDEFQNFITPSMAEMLAGTRKYNVGLVLAHQELRQLERDREVASAVLSNCHTRVVFRVSDDDARKLSEGFSFFEARDLQDLNTGQAICRIERSSQDFNLSVALPGPPDPVEADERRRKIITASREKYGTPRVDVEAGPEKRTVTGGTEALRKDAPVAVQEGPVPAGPFVPDEGRTLHESLKDRFILEGEKLFYTVTREHPVLDGAGRIDLVLVRGKRRIACEIAITTKAEWETGNVRKCLEAGFETVVVVAPDEKRLEQLREAATAALRKGELNKVQWMLPEAFEVKLRSWAKADPEGAEIEKGKPRRRKLELHHPDLSNTDRIQLEGRMLSEIANAMKRKS